MREGGQVGRVVLGRGEGLVVLDRRVEVTLGVCEERLRTCMVKLCPHISSMRGFERETRRRDSTAVVVNEPVGTMVLRAVSCVPMQPTRRVQSVIFW